jgi:hypothetical protein
MPIKRLFLGVAFKLGDPIVKGATKKFNKIKREKPHFTDIDYQKCTYSNGKLYI